VDFIQNRVIAFGGRCLGRQDAEHGPVPNEMLLLGQYSMLLTRDDQVTTTKEVLELKEYERMALESGRRAVITD
jgi:hypothetical protein